MLDDNRVLSISPFSLAKREKQAFLAEQLHILTQHHYTHCPEYKKILDALRFNVSTVKSCEQIPFLPVRLFKEFDLMSIPRENIVKTMTSSGTTGQQVSRIYLDKETSAGQTKVLTKIISSFIGSSRLPMIILDSAALLKNREMFSARGAGILGFSIFARDRIFGLTDNMELDIEGINDFLEKHQGEEILLFGFTYIIWRHFYQELRRAGFHPDLSKGIMIHGGGWKKLDEQSVPPENFKTAMRQACGITRVYEYYGMVEQTGSVYMECECGYLHASVFSDVIIRRPADFSVAQPGESGIIEVISILPQSYPGHVLLTEDEGVIVGEDDCACGRKGKYFRVRGRLKDAEIRGCSDTYAG
ncbi:MAG: acyl-protein synthetase [Peptococcaceae bacterium]|nr:acyl-protein synthetase [Peptococcaceae bacterium]